MQLYNEKDLKMAEDSLEKIIEDIEDKKLEKFEPTKEELLEINKIVLDYVREHKRKIYGGFAQNRLVEIKNESDAFYKNQFWI